MRVSIATLCLVFVAASVASSAAAQMPAPGTVSSSAAISGVAQFDKSLDTGGDFSFAGVIAAGSITRQFTPQFSAGLSITYTYEDWKFGGDIGAFGGQAPWSNISRPIIGTSLTYAVTPDWIVNFTPSIGWEYASGASTGDALVYGTLASATKVVAKDRSIGIGVGVYREVYKTKVYPLVIVDWKIDDHWSISNPFPAGPTGGAGLELVYDVDGPWEFSGGGAYRQSYFRLAKNGPYPDGIGETEALLAFFRATFSFSAKSRIDLYAGGLFDGKLTAKNGEGNDVASDRFNGAPIVGITFAAQF